VEPVWHSVLGHHQALLLHRQCIDHHQIALVLFPVVDRRQQVAVVLNNLGVGAVTLLVVALSRREGITQVQLLGDLEFLAVELDHCIEVEVV